MSYLKSWKMLGRKRIKELEAELANLKEIITGKDRKIGRIEKELNLIFGKHKSRLHEIINCKTKISGLEAENEKLQSKIDELESNKSSIELGNVVNEMIIDSLIKVLEGVSEIKNPKEDKWHKEYQKVMRKLEKITGKNKPF